MCANVAVLHIPTLLCLLFLPYYVIFILALFCVKPFTGGSTVFASHAWGAKWGDLVLALARSVPHDAYVWVDVFAVRQWPGNGADLDFKGVIKRSTVGNNFFPFHNTFRTVSVRFTNTTF